jgi:carbamoyl-phosphate synthase large subunit
MSKNKKEKISILITGVGGGGVGEGILKTIKLAKGPYRIVVTDNAPTSMGFYNADAHYAVPKATNENYIKTLLDICEKENIQVLIPGSEPELKKISENRELFKKNGILLLINDAKIINLCMDKWQTYQFLKQNNLPSPASYLIKKEKQLTQIKKFPVVIKPVHGGSGSSNVFIAQDKEELVFFVKYILKQNFIPLVQEYIDSPDQEYTVGVLTTFRGDLLGSIALKRRILSGLSNKIKVRYYKGQTKEEFLAISSGISQGIINDYPEIRRYAEKVALILKSKGPLNIQCRKTKKGIFIFEINPRFSGTTPIRALAGYNEPDILIRCEFLGKNIKLPIRFKKGIVMRGLMEKYIRF